MMKMKSRAAIGALLAVTLTAGAQAVTVHIEVTGTVDYNGLGGALAPVPVGSPVVMGFNVDSNVYVDSSNYPTRGYNVDMASFDFNVGGVHVLPPNVQPIPAYFVVRDNDPHVDGFFMSQGNVDNPFSIPLVVPGLTSHPGLNYSLGFDSEDVLHSLNILDAVGTYGYEHMGSFGWELSPATGFVYETMTISAVPEPTPLALLGLGGLAVLARVRKARAA